MNIKYWEFLAGLGCFLFALRLIEKFLEMSASHNFKVILRKYTDNHFLSIVIGVLATAILQSSSVVTLMLLALVGGKVIKLPNALGIILGANLGTTFTGWIVAYFGLKVDLSAGIYPLIAIGSILHLFFPSNKRLSSLGAFIFGFGLLLFGLNLMKVSMAAAQSSFDPGVLGHYHYLVFALAGALFTALIQSSSATMAITLTALNGQLISLEAACALLIGADLGTTGTVVLGSLGGGYRKKQVAAAHFIFNLVTDLVALLLLRPLIELVTFVVGAHNPLYSLVTFYSSFNLLGIFIFWPFLDKFSLFLSHIFTKKDNTIGLDINPSHPEAALISLKNATKTYLQKTLVLNSSLTQIPSHSSHKGNETQGHLLHEFGNRNYEKCYQIHKKFESNFLCYSLKLQENSLTNDQAHQLEQTLSCVRNCLYSAKGLKDIQHNLISFKASSNHAINRILEYTFGLLKHLYQAYDGLINEYLEGPLELRELTSLLNEVEKNYADILKNINLKMRKKEIPFDCVSNLYNVNREIYNSHYFYLQALAELVLSEENKNKFLQLPRGT